MGKEDKLSIVEREIIETLRDFLVYNKYGYLKINFNGGNIDLEKNYRIRLTE